MSAYPLRDTKRNRWYGVSVRSTFREKERMLDVATITRRLEKVLDELEQEFQALYTRDDFECQIRELRRAEKSSARPSALARLYRMLEQAGIPFEEGRGASYYDKLIQQADIPDLEETEERLLEALFKRYQKYPKPEEYMKRIVDRLEDPEDQWAEDPLRLRILKQFIKYGDYLKAADKGGKKAIQDYVRAKTGAKALPGISEVLEKLDDGVFAQLETAAKPQRKPEGKFGLLKAADDLACGKFREGGATRKDLYLFAMVYGMTYYTGRPDETIDYERDIEKNLFCDYYTNNLMRFVTDVYRSRLSDYEMDPSGQGINYKNFAEMVYLYYIRKKLPPAEKVRLSAQMIREIKETAFKKGGLSGQEEETVRGTSYYRDNLQHRKEEQAGEEVMEKSETDFARYLLQNYNCDTYTGTYMTPNGPVDGKMGEMQLEAGQDTAFRHYREILEALDELGLPRENCNYGLWFTDIASFEKYDHPGQEAYREYLELLLAINSFLGNTVQEEVSDADRSRERTQPSRVKTKALYISSPKEVTRTSMLVAYYYYFNELHSADEDARGKSFEEIFRLFKDGLDRHLVPSGYQPVSGRNIIDVVVIFSSYTFLNE